MPTFIEEVQTIEDGNAAEFSQRLSDRIETLGDALDLLEEWTGESRETRAELASKYDTAKTFARNEIRDVADDADVKNLPAEDLLDHPAVNKQTKQRLREYSTKLFVFLDEENSYGEARTELLHALDAELDLYRHLLPEIENGVTSVKDAQQQIARFAREETLGPENQTATDVLLASAVDTEA